MEEWLKSKISIQQAQRRERKWRLDLEKRTENDMIEDGKLEETIVEKIDENRHNRQNSEIILVK